MADNFGKYKEELQKRTFERKATDTKNRKIVVTIEVEYEVPYDQTDRDKILDKLKSSFSDTGIQWKYKTHTSYKYWGRDA